MREIIIPAIPFSSLKRKEHGIFTLPGRNDIMIAKQQLTNKGSRLKLPFRADAITAINVPNKSPIAENNRYRTYLLATN